MFVTSLEGFTTYQRERAWTWEHQVLLRAGPVTGDMPLGERLGKVRHAVLAHPRDEPRCVPKRPENVPDTFSDQEV